MSGYIGFSRSVRSMHAIEDFEIPISLINKNIINEFLNVNPFAYTDDELNRLLSIPLNRWKFVAEECIRPSSWHHTGKLYRATNHYSLNDIAQYLLENNYEQAYQEYKSKKNNDDPKEIEYVYLLVNIWGGTKRYPKIVGTEEIVGIKEKYDVWVYYLDNDKIRKIKSTGSKVEKELSYSTYDKLIQEKKQFKSTKRMFNKIIKLKGF
ncbi:hypothetical protein KND94_001953 [Staphylococcus pseudintermedius]|nr:hypothetical protein [Staphylococcus pseudintermedius]EGQ4238828.1 hypothetical protein [Staphylococcus pseudintermedius]EHP0490863.1 hypothetical protein [Staphylococcus pseudintermedius]EIA5751627.1 hypothetical protein [Staphylococcus pseudintermedius]